MRRESEETVSASEYLCSLEVCSQGFLSGVERRLPGLWSQVPGLSGWAVRLVNVWSVLLDGGGVLKIEAEMRRSRAGRSFRP